MAIGLLAASGCQSISGDGRLGASGQRAAAQASPKRIAVLFAGHGEPATLEEGFTPIQFWDKSALGPFGATLGVPPEEQSTIFAAGYEEIAQAMTYQFGDVNKNGVLHELALQPSGDVPAYFSWPAFKGMAQAEYRALGGSPHNRILQGIVENTPLSGYGAAVDRYLGMLDARPFIPDAIEQIVSKDQYDYLVVIPLFMASDSTHTQEVESLVQEWLHKSGSSIEVVWGASFYSLSYVRQLHARAVAALVETVRERLPSGVATQDIAVVLAAHGDPFKPPYPEFGYQPGDIHSNLTLTEDEFRTYVEAFLPYETKMGTNEYRPPALQTVLAEVDQQGKKHILVAPAVFPTACLHTMWDLAKKAVDRPVPAEEKVASRVLPSGNTVWYTSLGYGDIPAGAGLIARGLRFSLEVALLELFDKHPQALPGR